MLFALQTNVCLHVLMNKLCDARKGSPLSYIIFAIEYSGKCPHATSSPREKLPYKKKHKTTERPRVTGEREKMRYYRKCDIRKEGETIYLSRELMDCQSLVLLLKPFDEFYV